VLGEFLISTDYPPLSLRITSGVHHKNSAFSISTEWVRKGLVSFNRKLNDLFIDVKMYTKLVQFMSIFIPVTRRVKGILDSSESM